MLALALMLLAQSPQHRLVKQPNLPRNSLAFFEFLPESGAGTAGACSTTAPTGAKGETLTSPRATAATCTKTLDGVFATTGIANGDLVQLASNQAVVEPDATGVLELGVEQARTQIAIRSAEICNAAWIDVGTPACASDQAAGPFGTTTMDSVTDNDGAAFEGRSQVIVDTSQTIHTAFCYVKWSSGAAASASITLTGTGNAAGDCTGTKATLSTTTSSIVSCTGAAYGAGLTAVTVAIRVGTVAGDQGTLLIEGCDVKASSSYRVGHVPTTNVAVARSAELNPSFSGVSLAGLAASGSSAISVTPYGASHPGGWLIMNAAGRAAYAVTTTFRIYDGTNEPQLAHGFSAGVRKRYWTSWVGSTLTLTNVTDVTSNTGTFDGAMDTTGPLHVGASSVIGLTADWRVSRVCIDPNASRCR